MNSDQNNKSAYKFLAALFIGAIVPAQSFAGAPYTTDDPGVNAPGRIESNIASTYAHNDSGYSGNATSVEVNYGVFDRMDIRFGIGLPYSNPDNADTKLGIGDTTLGVKYQLVNMPDTSLGVPFVLTIKPAITLPTGDDDRGFGKGTPSFSVPLLFGTKIDKWDMYASTGFESNPGANKKDIYTVGGVASYNFNDNLDLGVELAYKSEPTSTGFDSTYVNFGTMYSLSEHDHLMLSVGRGITNVDETNKMSIYAGYKLTY